MSDPRHHDEDIRAALHDAVGDVEPAYRLDEIRARTTRQHPTEEGTMNDNARTWLVGAGGAVLATAAVIVTMVVVGNSGGSDETPTAGEPSTSSTPAPSEDAEPSPSASASETSAVPALRVTVPVYYTVDTPLGARLVREFRSTTADGDTPVDRVRAAATAAVREAPGDPDYTTLWPEDTQVTAARADGAEGWVVGLTSDSTDLAQLPDGVDEATAVIMRQQLVYTVQAVAQDRVPVELVVGDAGQDVGSASGVLGAGPGALQNADELDVLALMNITNPTEGEVVDGDTLMADGRSSGFEATVSWEVRAGDADGEVVADGVTTAEGWMDGLYPWTVEVDVSGFEPGTYVFVARNDDPTGGTEGAGDSADTKTFVVE